MWFRGCRGHSPMFYILEVGFQLILKIVVLFNLAYTITVVSRASRSNSKELFNTC